MPPEITWPGPALSNPRNRRNATVKARLGDQDPELIAVLSAEQFARMPTMIVIQSRDGTVTGHMNVSDMVWTPLDRTARFHLWDASNGGSGVWRLCHEVSVRLNDDEVLVTTIEVAPDRLPA